MNEAELKFVKKAKNEMASHPNKYCECPVCSPDNYPRHIRKLLEEDAAMEDINGGGDENVAQHAS